MTLPGYDAGDAANASPMIILPNQGRSITIGKSTYSFKVTGEDTYGKFGLFELRMQGGYGIKPHTHHELMEMFYVVDGDVSFLVGSEQKILQRGSIATIPRNEKHAFANTSSSDAILHIMFCPAAKRERYFEELASLAKEAGEVDPDRMRRLWEANDQFPADDPNWPF